MRASGAILVIPADATAQEARASLEAAGWRLVGTGDWSWVYGDAEDGLAARVTPFDPAFLLWARACLERPGNPWLPSVTAVQSLAGDGHVVVMERLWPADEARGARLCAALGVGIDSGPARAAATPQQTWSGEPSLAAARALLLDLLATGARRYRLWGGSDVRPGNVMADRNGDLKLIDPIFISGPAILEAIGARRRDLLSDFTRRQLEDFLTIPAFKPGAETDALVGALADLDLP